MSEENIKHNIINNLIDPLLFSSIRDTITGDTFYWYYNDFVNYRPCEEYRFTNEIIKDSNLTNSIFVNYLNMVKPVLDKINHTKIHSLRFNLFTKTIEQKKYLINHHKNNNVSILFVNNTNGGIEINNTFIKSTENQLVSFNYNTEYNIVTSTDNKIFTYLLINYE